MHGVLSTLPRHQGTRTPGYPGIRPLSPPSRPFIPAGMRHNAAVRPRSPFPSALPLRTWGRSSLLEHPRQPISGFPGNISPGQDLASLKLLLFLSRFPPENVADFDP